jgi:HD-GYP domain-containing protein (c-di-GMP phosphodiesterase class II)
MRDKKRLMTQRDLISIHRQLLWRLLLVSFIAALLAAVFVFLRERERISEVAVDRALQRLASVRSELELLPNPSDRRSASAIQRCVDILVSHRPNDHRYGRYVHLQIRSADGKEVAHYTDQTSPLAAVAERFVSGLDARAEPNGPSSQVVRLEGTPCVLVSAPMLQEAGQPSIWARGLFAESQEERSRTRWRAVWAALAVVGLVLAVAAVQYPILLQLVRRITSMSVDLLHSNLATIQVLGSAIAKRDSDTDAHNCRVTIYAVRLAEAVGIQPDAARDLIKGSLLHDVGKIGVSDKILLKPGRLTDVETQEMQKHVRYGVEIVEPSPWLAEAGDVVRNHHEKYDGTGYDGALRADQIPLVARIFAIADVFDALTSRRPYKEAIAVPEAVRILREGRGTHFDPHLLDTFEPMAGPLYEKVSQSDEGARQELDAIVARYFSGEPDVQLHMSPRKGVN